MRLRSSSQHSNCCRGAATMRLWADPKSGRQAHKCLQLPPVSPSRPFPILDNDRMSEGAGVVQRRIVVGAVLCAVAFALVGIRLVDVTVLRRDGARHVL